MLQRSTLLCLLSALGPGLLPAAAATWTVDDPGDGGGDCTGATRAPCTLRAAVEAANNNPGLDTIDLDVLSVTLSQPGADEDSNASGDLDVTDDLIVQDGTISGGALDRVFHVHGVSLALDGVLVFEGDVSTTLDPRGGAVLVEGGALTLVGAALSESSAEEGGGLYLDGGSLEMSAASEITLCEALYGGGAYLNASDTVLDGSGFGDNAAKLNGGGLLLAAGSSASLSASGFSDNSAGGSGGGAYVDGESALTTAGGSAVSANTAAVDGGGVYAEAASSGLALALSFDNTLFVANEAGDDGGGLFTARTGTAVLDSIFTEANTAGDLGGGIYAFLFGAWSVSGSELSGNSAGSDGGGVACGRTSELTVSDTVLVGNIAGGDGGGLFAESRAKVLADSLTASGNTAGGDGGGIALTASNLLELSGGGGGLAVRSRSRATLEDTLLSGNQATDAGGGLLQSGAEASLVHSALSDNQVTGGAGGGAYVDAGTFTLERGSITGNSASADGGGLYAAASAAITDSTLSSNAAGGDGGGAWVSADARFTRATVVENDADADHDGVGGYGVYRSGGALSFEDSVVALSTAGGSDDYDVTFGFASAGANLFGALGRGLTGNRYDRVGTLTAPLDPGLGGLETSADLTAFHTPQVGSPLIDAGRGAGTIDQPGNARPIDGDGDGVIAVDIGAVERQ
jgi:hypothetical protein